MTIDRRQRERAPARVHDGDGVAGPVDNVCRRNDTGGGGGGGWTRPTTRGRRSRGSATVGHRRFVVIRP